MSTKLWFENFNYSREEIFMICRFIFGQASYPPILHKIGILYSNMCEICDTTADLHHIFPGCSIYKLQIKVLINSLKEENIMQPCNMNHLLNVLTPCIINHLIFFNTFKIYNALAFFQKFYKLQLLVDSSYPLYSFPL